MSSIHKISVGVIGTGVLGRFHAQFYHQHPDVKLVGVYDIDPNTAIEVAKVHSTQPFSTIKELATNVDCVSIAVPTHRHHEVVSSVLNLGKHILVEKPLASTILEGRELIDAAKRRNLILQVGHVEQFNPVIRFLEKRIQDPRFIESHRLASYPPPRAGQLPRGTEVGVVLDLMIHDIDVITTLVKSEIRQIDAIGIPILSRTEDIANARLTFANGCVANLTASRVSQDQVRKIRVFQQNAYLSLDYQSKSGEIVTLDGKSLSREPVPIDDGNALKDEIAEFIRCVKYHNESGKIPDSKVTGVRGLNALEIASSILQEMQKLKNARDMPSQISDIIAN